jgi:hypothetical protein
VPLGEGIGGRLTCVFNHLLHYVLDLSLRTSSAARCVLSTVQVERCFLEPLDCRLAKLALPKVAESEAAMRLTGELVVCAVGI